MRLDHLPGRSAHKRAFASPSGARDLTTQDLPAQNRPVIAFPAWAARSNSGEGKIPKKTAAAANRIATNVASGCVIEWPTVGQSDASDAPDGVAAAPPSSSSASCDPPAIGAR